MRTYEIFEDGDNGPALYGTVTLDGGQVSFHPEPGHEAYMDSLRNEWMILDGGERGVSCTGSPEEWFDALPYNISNSYTDVVEKGVTKGAMPPKGGRFPDGVLKENPNHDELGRFAETPGGAGIKFDTRADVSLGDQERGVVEKGISRVKAIIPNAPQVKNVVVDPQVDTLGAAATKSNDSIYLNPKWVDADWRAAREKEWNGLIVGNGSLEATVAHEYGHIVDGAALNKVGSDQYMKELGEYAKENYSDPLWSKADHELSRVGESLPSGHGTFYPEESSEFIAECVADQALNGGPGSSEVSRSVVERLNKMLK